MAVRPTAAIFDLDGTIIDSLALTFEAMRDAVRPFLGRDVTDDELYARFGPADHQIVAGLVPREYSDLAVRRLMAAYERGLTRMPLFPGISDLLDGLADRDVVLALCTGRGRPSTDLIIQAHRLDRWFEVSVTGDEGGRPKPAPDGIHETLRRLDRTPDRVFYAGDSIKDVEAGLAAGALTAAARWGGIETDDAGFATATFQARQPRDILAWWDSRLQTG